MLEFQDHHGAVRGTIGKIEDLEVVNLSAEDTGDPDGPYRLAPSAHALLFARRRAAAKAAVIAEADAYAARLTSGYSKAEQDGWTAKAIEAREIALGALPSSERHPQIMAAAWFCGRSPADLAASVLAKAERLARAAGAIDGIRQAAFAAIDAAADEEALDRALAEARATAEAAFAAVAA